MTQHVQWSEIPTETVNPTFDRQYVVGDKVMVARLTMKKGSTVPEHHHHNEQISQIISGSMRFSMEGKEIILRSGEFLLIPPNVPHAAVALEDTIAIDTFVPPRQDWIDGTDAYLRNSGGK